MTDSASVGALVKRYRLAAGLSQEALAARAGVSARAVSDIERGVHQTPRGATLDLLAAALDLTPQRRAMLLAAAYPGAAPGNQSDHTESAAPAATVTPVHNLPFPPAPLIGREGERAVATQWVRDGDRRLLTLAGPGGVGKTRLALEIARDHLTSFPHGAIFVDLAPLDDPAQVPNALALALRLTDEAGRSPAERIAAHLRDQQLLLVLDNAERVIACAPFLAGLLAQCPGLFILATSRIPLRLRAERTLSIEPLPLAEAVTLFREFALSARPTWLYREDDVAAICARLDGLPLAIELAAAQARLAPPLLLDRLSQRLSILRDGPSDLPDRQRTMEATLDWSYDLLTNEQQTAFRALGVFPSGWTLDAAAAILAPDATAATEETILPLAALVDASLVQVDILPAGPIRWRLLDITRDYALARLRAAGEEERLMRRSAAHFAQLAETALTLGPSGQGSGGRLDLELPNVRAALEWAERRREADLGLRLAGFARVWHAHGQMREAADWVERMLALDADARAAGFPSAPAAVRVTRLYGLARVLLGYGDLQRAEARLHEALHLASAIQDHAGLSEAFATLGDLARAEGRRDLAIAAYTESHAHARLAPDGYPTHRALARLADAAQLRSDLDQAARYLEEALTAARAYSSTWESAMILTRLGHLAYERQQYEQACAYYQESLTIFSAFPDSAFTARSLEGLAAALSAEGRHAATTRLYAGAAAMRQRGASPAPPAERIALEATLARARRALGEPRYRAEWLAGAALSFDALLDEARTRASGRRGHALAEGGVEKGGQGAPGG